MGEFEINPPKVGSYRVDIARFADNNGWGSEAPAFRAITFSDASAGWYVRYAKRSFDIAIALTAVLLFSPILLLASLIVLAGDGAPVIYRQARAGLNLRPFVIAKFRTMVRDAEHKPGAWKKSDPQTCAEVVAAADNTDRDYRVYRGAAFLRRYSVDELPQLWNVLRGDMSIVGPRPLMCKQVDDNVALLGDILRMRSRVRPGITGLWQVSGRSDLTFDHMLKLDVEYVENLSFMGDVRILLKTISVVVRAAGAV